MLDALALHSLPSLSLSLIPQHCLVAQPGDSRKREQQRMQTGNRGREAKEGFLVKDFWRILGLAVF